MYLIHNNIIYITCYICMCMYISYIAYMYLIYILNSKWSKKSPQKVAVDYFISVQDIWLHLETFKSDNKRRASICNFKVLNKEELVQPLKVRRYFCSWQIMKKGMSKLRGFKDVPVRECPERISVLRRKMPLLNHQVTSQQIPN